ncbi:MAG: preprotein translocase subunit TatC [Methanosarcinales archaeon]|nr:MAG: preprotein translocase subunit TatC [Methanosarcinales archaeon]
MRLSRAMIETAVEIADILKKRLAFILVVFAIGTAAGFPVMDRVLRHIIEHTKPVGASIIYLTPLEVVMLKLKMAIICGALLALISIVYFIYRSVVKGTKIRICRSSAIVTGILTVILFGSGVLYAYFLLPIFLDYLYQSASSTGAVATYSIREFLSFVILIATVFGLSFELPLVMTVLVRSGLVRYRTFIEYRRHAYVGLLVAAAFFTPPDVLSQIIIAVPLAILYEISLVVVRFTGGDGG